MKKYFFYYDSEPRFKRAEAAMEFMIKALPTMNVVCFESYEPEPEKTASDHMREWLKKKRLDVKSQRIFGHNIDANGNLSVNPNRAGYKFMVVVDDDFKADPDSKVEEIRQGRFMVMGIEGNIEEGDKWIMEGWDRLNAKLQESAYKMKQPPRWYEAEVEPLQQGNMRLELFLEIE